MSETPTDATKMVRSFSLWFGLAWTMVIAILLIAAITGPAPAASPVMLFTLVVGIVGAVGAFAAWRLYRGGAIIFIAAMVAMLVKPWVSGLPAEHAGLPWGYLVMLGLYAFAVYQAWGSLRGGNDA